MSANGAADTLNTAAGLLARGHDAEAMRMLETASARFGASPELLSNLGIAYRRCGRPEAAEAAYRRAIALDGAGPEAHFNLANLLRDRGAAAEALDAYRAVLRLQPGSPKALNGIGVALLDRDELEAARASFEAAHAATPAWWLPVYNLARIAYRTGDAAAAEALFRETIARNPGYVPAHLDLAALLLKRGEFGEGWREYEWRAGLYPCPLPGAPWDGSDPAGKTLVLTHEQGYGDTLLHLRYARLLAGLGARVVALVPQPAVRLVASADGVSRAVSSVEELGPYDAHLPLPSCPHRFGTRLATIPGHTPYLHTTAQDRERAAALVPADGTLRVGVVWQCKSAGEESHRRDCDPRLLARLAVPGVTLYNLQFGVPSEGLPFVDLSRSLGDFASTAAIIETLDLVVTIDTATGHLAGALGKPVFTLLNARSDWRWLRDRDDSPWYPTMRLFRQATMGDWRAPLDAVAAEVAARARAA